MTSLACSALPAIGPGAAAAPWDPPVYALLTALSMQHCVLPTQCSASYRLYYALSKRRGIRVSVQEQQDTGCVRGAGDVSVLYGLNVLLAVLMDPPLQLLCMAVCVYVCASVRFIVKSRGIRGCFHLSVLITGESISVNCLCPGNGVSSTLRTCCMVSVV